MLIALSGRDYLESESAQPFLEPISQMEYKDDSDLAEPRSRRLPRRWLLFRCQPLTFVWIGLLVTGATVFIFGILKWFGTTMPPVTIDNATASGEPMLSSVLLSNNATATFRENLVPSMKYVTTFLSAGFTNQFMEITSLVYLSILTGRVPVVLAFLASHFGEATDITPTPFSEIFDLPYFLSKVGTPMVEWHELKQTAYSSINGSRPETEKIGCWSTAAGFKNSGPSYSYSPDIYGLDISYTPVPPTYTLTHGADAETYMWSIWGLASLGFAKSRMRVLPDQFRKAFPLKSVPDQKLEPDETMLCWDSLYYTGVFEPYPSSDFFKDYSPYWNRVGVHMRWKQPLVELANQYLRRHFDIQNETDPIPPFISVHIRRTDFEEGCWEGVSKDQCFAPVSAYKRRVQEVRARLKARNDADVREVLVTSDEQDSAWWKQVSDLGPEWRWIDHTVEKTGEKHGKWYPMLLDAIFQSMGRGFVGTERSTMSDLARVRVESWNDGESAMVRWGYLDADN